MEHHHGGPLRNVADVPRMAAHRLGSEPGLATPTQEVTYAELDERIDEVGAALTELDVESGDKIGLYLPNTLQFPEAYFGSIRAGAVPVPLNLRMDHETLTTVLEDADVDCLISSPYLTGGFETEFASVVAPTELATTADVSLHLGTGDPDDDSHIPYRETVETVTGGFDSDDPDYDDVAAQPYTSGTTGRPKGVPLTHRNLLTAVESLTKSNPRIDSDDTLLLVLPLFHIYGLNALLTTYLYSGATIVLEPVPEPGRILDDIEQYDVNHFPAVPAIYTMVYREYRDSPDEYDLRSLEGVNSAAAPLPEDTRETITEEWDVVMGEGWGMTETSPAGTLRPIAVGYKDAGCIGRPVYNLELKLVDAESRDVKVTAEELSPRTGSPSEGYRSADKAAVTGEIAVRGPQVFEGYHQRPELNDEVFDNDGWFYTGDIARMDGDGDLWMIDRTDDLIIVGGENVYPAEIEEVLYDHPGVAEAAVVGVPHEVKGQAPVAFVVRDAAAETSVDEAELRRYALDHVPTYAHPRRVFFVKELPRSATEKVQRFELESMAEVRLDGSLEPSDRVQ